MKKNISALALAALFANPTALAAKWSAIKNIQYSWTDAYRLCANLKVDGRSDWRLPTALELNGRYKNTMNKPAWDPKGSGIDWLWSSSQKGGGPYFMVNANNGSRSWADHNAYVTCIADSTVDPDSWIEDAQGAIKVADWNRAIRIIAPYVKQKNPYALIFMGKFSFDGTGVQKNETEAFKFYLAAAQQGHAVAQISTAALYELGRGTSKDIKSAIYWYEKAAAQNEPGAAEAASRLRTAH